MSNNERLQELNKQLKNVEEEIYFLENEYGEKLSQLNAKADKIEQEIKTIELEKELRNLDYILNEPYTGDAFWDAIIRASKVASTPTTDGTYCDYHDTVFLGENIVAGTNSHIGIVTQIDVPAELRKTVIPSKTITNLTVNYSPLKWGACSEELRA